MATDSEIQTPSAARAFPTPSTTPYRNPARVRSRPSLHRADSSSVLSSSPTSLPMQNYSPDGVSYFDDGPDEDDILPFDPRRFTPTLHASLVSEILSLRREVESKSKAIDVLERSLDDSRTENESLGENLAQGAKETRSLKHQLQLLEGGSSSALTELAKERDDALENISDVRKKLEQAQKKIRSREEDAERTQTLWDRERESWEADRRSLERKVHVVEGRLKTVLNEVAAAQAAGSFRPKAEKTEMPKEGANGNHPSDSGSIYSSSPGRRRTSVTSMSTDDGDFHNVRFSVMSVANQGKNDGLNLAEELAFDEEEEFEQLDDESSPYSPEALPEERPTSVQSQLSHHTIGMGMKARKILGLSMQGSVDGQGVEERALEISPVKSTFEREFVYQDAGIQYSPPPSPTLPAKQDSLPAVNEANSQIKDSSTLTLATDMVSTSCQTNDLPSPPWTPKVEPSPEPLTQATMTSTSTQTEQPLSPERESKRDTLSPDDAEMDIPMIAIHPPRSEPASPRGSVVLPPQTKNVSCQADFTSVPEGRSIAVQTEGIRIDQRPVKLPASLLPSAIPDLPLSTASDDLPIQPYRAPPPRVTREEKMPPPPPIPEKAPSRNKPTERVPERVPERVQAYPPNNDNGPLSDDLKSGLRRPPRTSSLFAGFEQNDEEPPEAEKDIFSEDALLNRPTVSYQLRRGKLVSAQPGGGLEDSPLSEIDEHLQDNEYQLHEAASAGDEVRDTLFGPPRGAQRAGAASVGLRQQDIRRAAMISSGAAAHQRIRARSPSEPSIDSGSGSASTTSSIPPPFPVPIRLSSRKFPHNGSEGRQSPTPSSRNFSDRGGQSVVRRPTIRRVRSETTVSQPEQFEGPDSLSSPAMSASSYVAESPRRPPLPFDDITAPRHARRRSTRASSIRPFRHERMDSTATSVQQTSVVDAIAQTMVGEWMFKYIRRRRSFGGDSKDTWEGKNADEVSVNITNSGSRHKRWVWLAPYEGSIMWSSKQPTNGPALLGKSGRKFTIQSVLDVKDDNPLPKGFNQQNHFNRSILILTPQRALKFTAMSIERHYVWLTALSFLSHSAMGMRDLAALPPVPQEEFASPAPSAALRKNPIRDSIRVAKGKPRPNPKGKYARPTVPELPEDGLEPINSIDSAADPPTVPRFSNHNRKRSNTAPRMPAIRSFSSMPSSNSGSTVGSSDMYVPPMHSNGGLNSGRSSISRHTSEASGRSNFFDAIGTVRMEAFIDQTESNRPRAGSRATSRRPRNGSKASSQWSQGYGGFSSIRDLDFPMEDSSELYFNHDDPFRGF